MLIHPFPPLFDENSRVLILGSFPSVKSREQMFFYGHPQNRFWKVIAAITEHPVPQTIDEKREMILGSHIALWDSIASCNITGSSDASLKDVVPNDISVILDHSRVNSIFTNGSKSHEIYMKYIFPSTGISAVKLPSTSPANASYSLEKLTELWQPVKDALK